MVLYLISVGLSVTMGLMGFVNLAHGVFAMAGGYVLTSLMSRWGAALVTALWLGIERTRFGARVRASVDNLRMAQSVGIDTSRLFMATFALGSGLAGLGGGLGADLLAINPSYALQNLAYFLIVVAVGGLGSIRGPFVAALLLGIADSAFNYLLPDFGAFFMYTLTMAILLWRPRGLFGRA